MRGVVPRLVHPAFPKCRRHNIVGKNVIDTRLLCIPVRMARWLIRPASAFDAAPPNVGSPLSGEQVIEGWESTNRTIEVAHDRLWPLFQFCKLICYDGDEIVCAGCSSTAA